MARLGAPGRLLSEARGRAGLTQREVARRAETSHSVVARIEKGRCDPSTATLARLLAAVGFELRMELLPLPAADTHMLEDVARILSLTPEERLLEVRNVSRFAAAALDPERIIRVLAAHSVRYVLIGALAARLQGFPGLTPDAGIAPDRSRDSLARLAVALRKLGARVYTESVPEGLSFGCSAKMLARSEIWNLVTSAGRLDIVFVPSGNQAFADLARNAVRFDVFGVELLSASLADIIRSKQGADRPQDRQDVVLLSELLRRAERSKRERIR